MKEFLVILGAWFVISFVVALLISYWIRRGSGDDN